jgi:hypothetical protein
MGKTALLRHSIAEASASDAVVIYAEASNIEPLPTTLRQGLERARRASASLPQKVKSGLEKVIEALPNASFELPHELGAVALSATHKQDATFVDSLEELNDAVRRHGKHLVFAIDEIQSAPIAGLQDLVRFVHNTAGTKHPVFFMGAGLPNSRAHLHEVRTYTERWRYYRLGLLTPEQTHDAISIPARDRGIQIEPDALTLLVEESAGYPFFIQEFASAAWLEHHGDVITVSDAEHAILDVRGILEDDFYDARFRLLTPREMRYVFALAELGPGPHTAGDVAERLGATSDVTSSIRNQLVKKDMIYSPSVGMVEFRIPLTERFITQHKAELGRRAEASGAVHRRRSRPS